jgi:hypothetical protein
MGEPERRRRRLRPPSAAAAPIPSPPPDRPPADPPRNDAVTVPPRDAAITTPVEDPVEIPRPTRVARTRPTSGAAVDGDDREAERGLRGLVGSGSSQVSVGAALRARDAARPTDEQLADAEENLTIVRRNWLPREDLPRNR